MCWALGAQGLLTPSLQPPGVHRVEAVQTDLTLGTPRIRQGRVWGIPFKVHRFTSHRFPWLQFVVFILLGADLSMV